MLRFLKGTALVAIAVTVGGAAADAGSLGRAATPEEIAAWDIDIRPDGAGLPEGSGDVSTGEEIFIEKCAVCHGDFAEGVGRWPVLAGGRGSLTRSHPVKTVGSYWPYLSTVYDYVNRAMPFGEAQSLEPDEVYAIVAYILYSNDIVDDEFTLSRDNFLEVEMPNAAGFIPDDRLESPIWTNRDACMENCKTDVEITKRAAVIDVTPEEAGDGAGLEEAPAEAIVVAEAETAPPAEAAVPEIDAALADAGEKVFKKCKACHEIGEGAQNKTGPLLTGIVGHPIGKIEGFKYSKVFSALADEGAVWDEAALDAFLTKPRAWAKGTKMSFGGLKKAEDRAALIEYLKAASQ